MRYSMQAISLELVWESETDPDWQTWLEEIKNAYPDGKGDYDVDAGFAGFSVGLISGTAHGKELSARLRIDPGVRRSTLLKAARQFLASVVGLLKDDKPFLQFDMRTRTKLPKDWGGVLGKAVTNATISPWVSEKQTVDFIAVRYYIRDEGERLFVKLDLTPGFVEDSDLQVRLEVLHTDVGVGDLPHFDKAINRVLDKDIPKLVTDKGGTE